MLVCGVSELQALRKENCSPPAQAAHSHQTHRKASVLNCLVTGTHQVSWELRERTAGQASVTVLKKALSWERSGLVPLTVSYVSSWRVFTQRAGRVRSTEFG